MKYFFGIAIKPRLNTSAKLNDRNIRSAGTYLATALKVLILSRVEKEKYLSFAKNIANRDILFFQ